MRCRFDDGMSGRNDALTFSLALPWAFGDVRQQEQCALHELQSVAKLRETLEGQMTREERKKKTGSQLRETLFQSAKSWGKVYESNDIRMQKVRTQLCSATFSNLIQSLTNAEKSLQQHRQRYSIISYSSSAITLQSSARSSAASDRRATPRRFQGLLLLLVPSYSRISQLHSRDRLHNTSLALAPPQHLPVERKPKLVEQLTPLFDSRLNSPQTVYFCHVFPIILRYFIRRESPGQACWYRRYSTDQILP